MIEFQLDETEQKARERGWTVIYRLSDNDIGVTRKDPTKPGKYRLSSPSHSGQLAVSDTGLSRLDSPGDERQVAQSQAVMFPEKSC